MTLPAAGPTSRQLVTSWLPGGVPPADESRVDRLAAAVNAWVRTLPVCDPVKALETAPELGADGASWTGWEHITEGATMMAARLYRRKNTPDGVAVFGGDTVAYVRRTDPDVAQLLQLGDYAPPAVG